MKIQKLLMEFDPSDLDDMHGQSATRIIFDSAMARPNWSKGVWRSWSLPALREPRAFCGKLGFNICPDIGGHEGGTYVECFTKTCGSPQCRVCVEDWAIAEANRAKARLLEFSDMMRHGSVIRLTFPQDVRGAAVKSLLPQIKWDLGVLKLPNGRFDCTDLESERSFFTQCQIDNARIRDVEREYGVRVEREFSGRMKNAIHATISPRPEDYDITEEWAAEMQAREDAKASRGKEGRTLTESDLWDLKHREMQKKVSKVMHDVGVIGAVVVFHPFRFRKDDGMMPYPSPHFHIIGFGWIEHVRETFERHGVVFKKISTLRDKSDYFNTMKYVLSHCGVRNQKHSAVWTGALSYGKLKVVRDDVESKKCPHCGLELKPGRIPDDKLPFLTGIPPPFKSGFVGITRYPLEVADFCTVTYYDPDNYWEALTMDHQRISIMEEKLRTAGLSYAESQYLQSSIDLIRSKLTGVESGGRLAVNEEERRINRARLFDEDAS